MASNLKLIWVRVSDEDFERLKKKARKHGLSLNNYLRLNSGLGELKHGGPREYKVPAEGEREGKRKKKMLDAA